ncbi:MAG: hypothetical protein U9N14_03395, partial [Pseudomonadota bacterium]|nr:hypothetical protein [Pseudomonadota bacterium]
MNLERGLGLTEGLAIFGLAQCLLIVSYILIRTQDRHQVLFPLIYFGALALAFALRIGVAVCFEPGCYTDTPVWLVELAFPPLSFLLILQVAENRFVGGRVFLIGLVPIIAIGLGLAVAGGTRVCADGMFCSEAMNILEVFGVLSAGACLLVVWLYCRLLERLVRQPS